MRPAENNKVNDNETSRYWFDEDGILCVITKNVPESPLEVRKQRFNEFKKELGDKKVCMIVDISKAAPSSRESRAFNSEEFPKVFKAIAFVASSALGKMLGHLYLGMRSTPFPTRIFSNEREAREWIKEYL